MEIDIKDRLAIYELAYKKFYVHYNQEKLTDEIISCDGICHYLRLAFRELEGLPEISSTTCKTTPYLEDLIPALLEFCEYMPEKLKECSYDYYSVFWWGNLNWDIRNEVFIDMIDKTKKLIEDVQND